MKLKTLLLLALLILGAAVFYLVGTGASPAGGSNGPGALSEEAYSRFNENTLVYVDPELFFSLRYPSGYVVNAEDGAAFSFFSPTDTGFSEAHTLAVTNESFTTSELEQTLKADLPGARKISQQEVSANGRRVARFQYLAEAAGHRLHVVQTLIPCTGASFASASGASAPGLSDFSSSPSSSPASSPYSLYYVAVIPEGVKDDVALADYVIGSVSC